MSKSLPLYATIKLAASKLSSIFSSFSLCGIAARASASCATYRAELPSTLCPMIALACLCVRAAAITRASPPYPMLWACLGLVAPRRHTPVWVVSRVCPVCTTRRSTSSTSGCCSRALSCLHCVGRRSSRIPTRRRCVPAPLALCDAPRPPLATLLAPVTLSSRRERCLDTGSLTPGFRKTTSCLSEQSLDRPRHKLCREACVCS